MTIDDGAGGLFELVEGGEDITVTVRHQHLRCQISLTMPRIVHLASDYAAQLPYALTCGDAGAMM